MLRSEIHDSVDNLINAIKDCDIIDIFSTVLDNERETNTQAALHSYSKFLKITQKYNTFENQLLEMFDLEKLTDPNFWASILKRDDPQIYDVVKEMYTSTRFLLDHLPKMLVLTGKDTDKVSAAVEEGQKNGFHYVILSVVVAEEDELSSPQRLILLFESIKGLYEVAGRKKNLPVQSLSVASCDSGADKNFDFLGLSEIIEDVRKIILSVWDGVVYYREDKTGRQLDLITKSLAILEEINKLEQSGKFEKEEAEILRRLAVSSVKKFAQAGVTISEMEDVTRFDPRELMRPDRKLLVAPGEAEPPKGPDSGMVVVEDEEEEDEYSEPESFEAEPEVEDQVEEPELSEEAVVDPETTDDLDQFIKTNSETESDPFAEVFAETVAEVAAEPESSTAEPTVEAPDDDSEPESFTEPAMEEPETTSAVDDSSEPFEDIETFTEREAAAAPEQAPEPNPFDDTADIPEIEIEAAAPLDELIKSKAFAASVEDATSDSELEDDPFGVSPEDGLPVPELETDLDDIPEHVIDLDDLPGVKTEAEAPEEAGPKSKTEAAEEADASMDNYFERIAAGYLKMKQKQEAKKDKGSLE
ncbi:MAG: hypothetical protein K9N35_09870 [Candidatus Marinimicrobia bacterium]|nr:hypothetical protein [Candidatus Neomarinimicrobiota bacterium]